MPRRGPAYPITRDWQRWVRDRIDEMKANGEISSQNALAKKAGIAGSSLSEALADDAVQTTVMPEIHRALGWPPPLMAPPVRILRLVESFVELSEFEQGRQIERLAGIVAKKRGG